MPSPEVNLNVECPQAPVFYPTKYEFQDPMAYIRSIRPEGQKYGICKIVPPADWNPPFSLDKKRFRFSTRKQRIDLLQKREVGMISILGQPLYPIGFTNEATVPSSNTPQDEALNLKEQKVENLVCSLCSSSCHNDLMLKCHLCKQGYHNFCLIPQPFQMPADLSTWKCNTCLELYDGNFGYADGKTYSLDEFEKKANTFEENYYSESATKRRAKRIKKLKLKALQSDHDSEETESDAATGSDSEEPEEYPAKQKRPAEPDVQMTDPADLPNNTLPINLPDNSESPSILIPPSDPNKADQDTAAANSPNDPSGAPPSQPAQEGPEKKSSSSKYHYKNFKKSTKSKQDEAQARAYELERKKQLQKIADYWRIVETGNYGKAVEVEYGSDLDASVVGSAFPSTGVYARSGWNIINLPNVDKSVMSHLRKISGVTVPWVYIGSLFSSFCFHVEDHNCYSINYNHLGAAKQWYGIPGASADEFERVMKLTVPHLFERNPDLFFSMLTMVSPATLSKHDVPCYATTQAQGEFVVTFPRAYHGGFNMGYNCAEAVNFGPPDWLSIGRLGIEQYRKYHRTPVFSHDMLICGLAKDVTLNLSSMCWTKECFLFLKHEEETLRNSLYKQGVTKGYEWNDDTLPNTPSASSSSAPSEASKKAAKKNSKKNKTPKKGGKKEKVSKKPVMRQRYSAKTVDEVRPTRKG